MIQGVQNPKPDSQVEMHAVYMFMLYQLRIFPILSKTAGKIGKGKRHVVQCRPVSSFTCLTNDSSAETRAGSTARTPIKAATTLPCLVFWCSNTQRIYFLNLSENIWVIRIHTNSYESYGNIFITYSSHIHHIFNAVTCCIHAALRALYAHVVPCHTSRHTSTWSSTAGHAHQREGHTLPRSLRSLKPLKYIYCIMVDDVWCPNTSYIWCVCTFDKLKHVERGFTRKNSEHANYWILLNWVGQETWNTTTISHDRR